MNPTTDELKLELKRELQKGIDRNKVLPLDWAMDRINPILEKIYQKGRLDVLEENHLTYRYDEFCTKCKEIAKIKEVLG